MKLLIRFLLLLSLSLASEQNLFAHTPPAQVSDVIPAIQTPSQPAGEQLHHIDYTEALKAQKKTQRKNCRKLILIDDEDDETVSIKKQKTGKPAPFLPAGHLIATAFYQLPSGLPGLPDENAQLPGQERISAAGNRLYVLFRVFRI